MPWSKLKNFNKEVRKGSKIKILDHHNIREVIVTGIGRDSFLFYYMSDEDQIEWMSNKSTVRYVWKDKK